MHWYSGGIAEAINVSKNKGAIFVVYIEGKDDKSKEISSFIESEEVSNKLSSQNFVAIKLEAGSVPHQQFSEFYKQTPVPSLYFIGKNGQPIKIITNATDAPTLIKDINDILKNNGPVSVNVADSASFISNEQAATSTTSKPANVVCENGVCKIKTSSGGEEVENVEQNAEDKLERAKELLEAKRLEKEREDKENEKRKELERRKMGQEVQKMKQWQEDQELKQLKEEREKEKRMEKEAKDRVLAQIAQDRADRAARFQPAASSTPTTTEKIATSSKADSKTALLQFKLPDGSTKTHEFPSSDKLISIINFVQANFNLNANKFTLSTTFPRRQFTEIEHEQTLCELNLTPNAVILVLPLNHGTVSTNRSSASFMGFLWSLLAPLFGIFEFIKAFLGFGGNVSGHVSGDQQQPSTSGKRKPNSGPSGNDSKKLKKQGNVHRLNDIKPEDDDDDENNTWNGNSTQQNYSHSQPQDLEYYTSLAVQHNKEATDSLGITPAYTEQISDKITQKIVPTSVRKAVQFLISQRETNWGWRNNTAKVLIALKLLNEYDEDLENVLPSLLEMQLSSKQMEIEIVILLWRHHEIPIIPTQLAQYSLALNALCHDPKQFHQHDLIATLQHYEPERDIDFAYATLAACSAKAHIRKKQIRRLLDIVNTAKDHNIVAMTMLALKCIVMDHRHRNLQHSLRRPSISLARQQQADGGYGNLYNTALAIQALDRMSEVKSYWNKTAARRYLEDRQDPDGAFTDSGLTADILLALVDNGLSAVRITDCGQQESDYDNIVEFEGMPKSFSSHGNDSEIRNITVTYTLWIGSNITENNTISITAPRNTSFYTVMQMAMEIDPHFAFEASEWPNGHYVHSLSGFKEEPMGYNYWLLYRLIELPDPSAPPANQLVAPVGVDDLLIEEGDHYLFWYKKL